MKRWLVILAFVVLALASARCAPIEYSVVIVEAAQAIAEAETAGASCTQEQLDRLSPVTANLAPDPGTALASSEELPAEPELGRPMCDAPYEYYAALEYIKKAREEVGYSDYEPALEYAREARVNARKARDIALNRNQERGR